MKDYKTKVAELQADVHMIWQLQCKNLYNSKNLGALAVRECLQNSIDAIRKAVELNQIAAGEGKVEIVVDGDNLIIQDNGCGMNLEDIHTKFLTLGGTTKGDGSVGGFGLAKSVILGCGEGFKVTTQDNEFSSDDIGKNSIHKCEFIQGMKIEAYNVQAGNGKLISQVYEFNGSILDYVASSSIDDVTIYLNKKLVKPWFVPTDKTARLPYEFNISTEMIPKDTDIKINVYKSNNSHSYLYVRLRGLTQYKSYLCWNANCNIVLDIDTDISPRDIDYPFSTNREGLKSQYQGIVEAIKDKVSQSPISISRNDECKETFYENKSASVDEMRSVAANFTSDAVSATIEKTAKMLGGMIPQGGYTKPSLIDAANQYNKMMDKASKDSGLTKSEIIKCMNKDVMSTLNNPLDYSWIVWEDDNQTVKISKKDQVKFILLWDSILKVVASNYSGLSGFTYYPGIICKKDTRGLCLEKNVNGNKRCYIMFNPHLVPNGDDMAVALYLMGLAAHELAHLACSVFEAHGETWAYTREEINISSMSQLSNLVRILRTMKSKVLFNKIRPNPCKGKSYDEIIEMAEKLGINTWQYEFKYENRAICMMHLVRAIKLYS